MSSVINLAPEHTAAAHQMVARAYATGKSHDAIVEELTAFGARCGYPEVEPWYPFGNAQSWDELDAYAKAEEVTGEMLKVQSQFEAIVGNIMADPDIDSIARADAIASAAVQFPARMAGAAKSGSAFKARLKALFIKETEKVAAPAATIPDFTGKFKAVPGPDGYRWVNIYSNTFRDKQKERFTHEAHADYEKYVDESKDFPELWFWHIPGSRMGVADLITQTTEGFMLASGTFDPGMENAAKCLSEMGELPVSHGFRYKDSMKTKDGTYLPGYRTFEISVLPPEAQAANDYYTGSVILKEETMLTKEKRDAAIRVLGAPFVESLEANLSGAVKSVNGDSFAFKAITTAIKDVVEGVDGPEPKEGMVDAIAPGPDSLASSISAALAPAMAAIETLSKTIGDVAAGQKAMTERVAAIEQSDGQRIAAKMKATEPFTPSLDSSTILDGRSAAAKEAIAGLSHKGEDSSVVSNAAPWLAGVYKLMQNTAPVGE